MIFYYGIRPTGDNLHIGHVMSLLNMFNEIRNNFNEVKTIYFLMAEIHAEISNIPLATILDNSNSLKQKILALLKSYCEFNNLNYIDIYNRVTFIFQNSSIGIYHESITYKFLPLIKVNDLLTNPIFVNSSNKSVAFMVYPVLQTFDVLLYCQDDDEMIVFVSGDQMANINIMKDICSKLKLNYKITFNVYDNVIYDYKCQNKMSKSLNNFVNFNDINEVVNYLKSYITFPRPTKTSIGNYKDCPFYNNILLYFMKFLNINGIDFELCNNGKVGCFECKSKLITEITTFIESYKNYDINDQDILTITVNYDNIQSNYEKLLCIIDSIRS